MFVRRPASSTGIILLLRKTAAEDVDAYEWAAQTTDKFEGELQGAFDDYRKVLLNAVEALPLDAPASMLTALPWQKAENQLFTSWSNAVGHVVLASGKRAGDALVNPLKFLLDNPYTAKWLATHGAERVTGVTDQTKQAIREEVKRGVERHRTVRETGVAIRELVGLNARQAVAWSRNRDQLVADGKTATQVEDQSQAYARKLLRQRSLLIARTETIDAMNHGQQAAWNVAKDQGLIAGIMERKWIAGKEDVVSTSGATVCSICLDFKGQTAPLNKPFVSRSGAHTRMAPTAHPGCRCTVGLTYDRAQLRRDAARLG